jgi:hypothetical protein
LVNQANGLDADTIVDAVVSRHCCDNSLLALRDTMVVSPRQARRMTLEPGRTRVAGWTLALPTSLAELPNYVTRRPDEGPAAPKSHQTVSGAILWFA